MVTGSASDGAKPVVRMYTMSKIWLKAAWLLLELGAAEANARFAFASCLQATPNQSFARSAGTYVPSLETRTTV